MNEYKNVHDDVGEIPVWDCRAESLAASERDVEWWLEILELDLVQSKPMVKDARRSVQLFADARSHPPRLAAVLLILN